MVCSADFRGDVFAMLKIICKFVNWSRKRLHAIAFADYAIRDVFFY